MIRHIHLEHEFVESFPDCLQPGVIYISMQYATASHLCCCGCGEEVVTPFSPTDWKMTFDGESISLWPSIGNWNLKCRSHYILRENRAFESAPWTREQIEAERRRDRLAKSSHAEPISPESSTIPSVQSEKIPERQGILHRFFGWFNR